MIRGFFCLPKELLSEGDVEDLLEVTGCSAELRRPSCNSDCRSERYRSITGECNNKSALDPRQEPKHASEPSGGFFRNVMMLVAPFRKHPRWGAANIPYSRWLPPEYEDGWGAPRGWDPDHTYHNATLPPVRVLAAALARSLARPLSSPAPTLRMCCRCGWFLRTCCSLTTTTSPWTPPCPTCWWSGVSG